eukprot:CAMPEP_0171455436 /NCGR_PEP_ID=MMETSP0945-20130129/2333_1 /TAXON_ID=109269 /ORGANISM="Vaucheria litorea, Strain CCMP2940" /LENGTH=290 /DNA_ID=CAMNT_0011980679 /DNA_START=96 /DNA_END=969 /DNA_ORIENTATION=-
MAILTSFVAALLATSSLVSSYSGDLTFYGGAGKKGSCSQNHVPPGFKTVAINAPQYDDGASCGSCLEGCYNKNGQTTCFKAIVDNLCPECSYGDLDLGESGDGRFDIDWNFTECPKADLKFSTEGSNQWYGKIKVEGGGPIQSMVVNGKTTSSTPDAFWVVDDGSGKLGCGPKVTVNFLSGRTIEKCLPGSLFGGSCESGDRCSEEGRAEPPKMKENGGENIRDAPTGFSTRMEKPAVRNRAESAAGRSAPACRGVPCSAAARKSASISTGPVKIILPLVSIFNSEVQSI